MNAAASRNRLELAKLQARDSSFKLLPGVSRHVSNSYLMSDALESKTALSERLFCGYDTQSHDMS